MSTLPPAPAARYAAPMPAPMPAPADAPALDPDLLAMLACPVTRSPLRQEGDHLVAAEPADTPLRYPIRGGVPILLQDRAELPAGVASLDAFCERHRVQ